MKYCVTGGTGFIASHIIKTLLVKGHTVRATVRDPDDGSKVQFLWDMEGAKEKLELVKADLTVDGSFDQAVDGVDGVFHTASPVLSNQQNIQETLIDPAIKGTRNVLISCAKASSVRRVVLTSSCSAVRYRDDATIASPLGESHWSDPDYCRRYNLWYAYAKTIAEKEAWRLAKEMEIELVVVNPSFVIGPLLAPNPSSTLAITFAVLKGIIPSYPNLTIGFVHIDDVVECHIIAMENKKASGRLICSGPVAHWSEIVKMLKSKYPNYPIADRCGDQRGDDKPHSMDTNKIRELGLSCFTSIEQMFDDCIQSFQENQLL
ncbi:tetraketide alpha-pyrone reductase 2-like isoform X1 [Carex rostrata]